MEPWSRWRPEMDSWRLEGAQKDPTGSHREGRRRQGTLAALRDFWPALSVNFLGFKSGLGLALGLACVCRGMRSWS